MDLTITQQELLEAIEKEWPQEYKISVLSLINQKQEARILELEKDLLAKEEQHQD